MHKRRISVIGLGPVGLVTAVSFAKQGYKVVGIDSDANRVDALLRRQTPFFEPKLDAYLKDSIDSGMLSVSTDLDSTSDFVYVTVGTPCDKDGKINLEYVKKAASNIGRSLRDIKVHQVIVIKSTVIPGTARTLVRPEIERESGKSAGKDFGICSNPEFLREGRAIEDAEYPDRIVIGSDEDASAQNLVDLYHEFHGSHTPTILRTTHENAELIKYANNAFLATKISFINTIANIAERIPNADVTIIAKGIGLDQRISPGFLNAGLGFGGSCFPKDVNALINYCKVHGYIPQLLEATLEVNRLQALKVVEFARKMLKPLNGRKIAILGLAFKPGTDDMREAVSIPIIESLIHEGAEISACDPAAVPNARKIFGQKIQYFSDPKDCLEKTDLAIVVTEWDEFRKLTSRDFINSMNLPIIFDGRRIYGAEMRSQGITYGGVGIT